MGYFPPKPTPGFSPHPLLHSHVCTICLNADENHSHLDLELGGMQYSSYPLKPTIIPDYSTRVYIPEPQEHQQTPMLRPTNLLLILV